jgi:Tfp pilus assembly protein FimT
MKKGVTLLELTVVMAILMIVTGAVLISTRGDTNDYRALHNAALMLQADMRYAQRIALIEGRRVGVHFEPSHNRYSIMNRTVYLPNGVELLSTTYTFDEVFYLQRGTASAAGTIDLQKGRHTVELTTTLGGGRVEIKPITSQ